MKGFKLNFKGNEFMVGLNNGITYINLVSGESMCSMHVSGANYDKQENIVWCNQAEINVGDLIEIECVNVEQSSPAIEITENKEIKSPKTKIEMYLELERDLKRRNLI